MSALTPGDIYNSGFGVGVTSIAYCMGGKGLWEYLGVVMEWIHEALIVKLGLSLIV